VQFNRLGVLSLAFVFLPNNLVTESMEKLGIKTSPVPILSRSGNDHHPPSQHLKSTTTRRPPHHSNLQIATMRPKGPLVPVLHSTATHSESPSARGDLVLMLDPKPLRVEVKTFDAWAFPSPLLDSSFTAAKKLVSTASS
jgi:hypothetical protein